MPKIDRRNKILIDRKDELGDSWYGSLEAETIAVCDSTDHVVFCHAGCKEEMHIVKLEYDWCLRREEWPTLRFLLWCPRCRKMGARKMYLEVGVSLWEPRV